MMENILTDFDAVNLIHSTCSTTTKHLLQQREILSHQPLIIEIDEIEDFIYTSPLDFNLIHHNHHHNHHHHQSAASSPSDSSSYKKRRYSSEIDFHSIQQHLINSNEQQQQNETINENEIYNNSSASSSPLLTSFKSFSPLLRPITLNIQTQSSPKHDLNKKRKRSEEDEDDLYEDEEDELKLEDNNNNNNNNNLKKFQSKLHKSGSFIIIPKFINLSNNNDSNTNNNNNNSGSSVDNSTNIFNISKTMKDNLFCLIKPPNTVLESLLV